jgi:hypothetical protein
MLPLAAEARPITYPGGWSLMTMNDMDVNTVPRLTTLQTLITLFGWRHDYWRGPKANMDAAQINYLLKRWNNPGSQGKPVSENQAQALLMKMAKAKPLSTEDFSRRLGRSPLVSFLTAMNFFLRATSTKKHPIQPVLVLLPMKAIVAICIHGSCCKPIMTLTGTMNFLSRRLSAFFKGTTLGEAGVNLDGGVYFHLMKTF